MTLAYPECLRQLTSPLRLLTLSGKCVVLVQWPLCFLPPQYAQSRPQQPVLTMSRGRGIHLPVSSQVCLPGQLSSRRPGLMVAPQHIIESIYFCTCNNKGNHRHFEITLQVTNFFPYTMAWAGEAFPRTTANQRSYQTCLGHTALLVGLAGLGLALIPR